MLDLFLLNGMFLTCGAKWLGVEGRRGSGGSNLSNLRGRWEGGLHILTPWREREKCDDNINTKIVNISEN